MEIRRRWIGSFASLLNTNRYIFAHRLYRQYWYVTTSIYNKEHKIRIVDCHMRYRYMIVPRCLLGFFGSLVLTPEDNGTKQPIPTDTMKREENGKLSPCTQNVW
jgi:hypothetical protein